MLVRRMQQQVAGNLATNFGIINPLVLNQFGYGAYGQVCLQVCKAVFRIRIHMFLGLPDPDPLVRGMDPAPDLDPSIIM
jgi:hypothetical protein